MPHDERNESDRDPLVLLRALGSNRQAPAEAVRNVTARLSGTLPAGALEIGGPDVTGEPVPLEPTTRCSTPASSDPAADAARNVVSDGVVAIARPWTWAIGLTLAGAAAGGTLHASFFQEKVRVVYIDRLPDLDRHTAPVAPGPMPAAVSASAEVPSAPSDSAAAGGSPAANSSWSKERTILDGARRALANGEPEACLSELGKHARAFPAGKLAEEREALAVNALVGVGRHAEARRKAELFARRYPHSFLAPSVQAAILAIP